MENIKDKILLVEDDAALTAGLVYSMEKEGFSVTTASCVREGEEKFSKECFSIVVLDIGLPDGTGFDLCRIIREKSQVPILFLTACDEETNVVMGLDMGGDDYITKPFRLRELISRVRALLRRSSVNNSLSAQTESNGFRLLTDECRLFKGNEEIQLTPAEYKLICLMMSNRNRTLTRDVILQKLWDSGGDFVDANTLSVYMRRLREKIEKNPSSPEIIVTIRGVGYRWVEK